MVKTTTLPVKGLRELDKNLGELGKRNGKAVLKRVLVPAAKPFADDMERDAPVEFGDLQESVDVSDKLTPRQKRVQRSAEGGGAGRRAGGGFRQDAKSYVEMYVGAGALPQAHLQEFGTKDQPPQPFARPAWDNNKMGALRTIVHELGSQIMKTAARMRKRR